MKCGLNSKNAKCNQICTRSSLTAFWVQKTLMKAVLQTLKLFLSIQIKSSNTPDLTGRIPTDYWI